MGCTKAFIDAVILFASITSPEAFAITDIATAVVSSFKSVVPMLRSSRLVCMYVRAPGTSKRVQSAKHYKRPRAMFELCGTTAIAANVGTSPQTTRLVSQPASGSFAWHLGGLLSPVVFDSELRTTKSSYAAFHVEGTRGAYRVHSSHRTRSKKEYQKDQRK